MDFVKGQPRSSAANSILVLVDKFSRYAHFVSLSHPFTAFQVTQIFVANIYKLHGLPKSLIFDHDTIFTSTLWQELFRLTHTKLCMSTNRHPQTDGQTEQVNQCMETFLRCFFDSCPSKWSTWLPLVRQHLASLYSQGNSFRGVVRPCTTILQDCGSRHMHIHGPIILKLQLYVQRFMATCTNQKLVFRYFGPFKILQRASTTHHVLHVCKLRQALPPTEQAQQQLPHVTATSPVPKIILTSHLCKQKNKEVPQILVRWTNQPVEFAP